jgi:hypothetical protein
VSLDFLNFWIFVKKSLEVIHKNTYSIKQFGKHNIFFLVEKNINIFYRNIDNCETKKIVSKKYNCCSAQIFSQYFTFNLIDTEVFKILTCSVDNLVHCSCKQHKADYDKFQYSKISTVRPAFFSRLRYRYNAPPFMIVSDRFSTVLTV